MSVYYVDSNAGAPSSPYSSWATAAATIAACISAGAGANDIIKVHTGATPHLESGTATITLTGPTSGAPLTIVGVDKNNSDAYNVATANILVVTSGSNDIIFNGSFAVYGLWMSGSDDLNLDCDYNELQYFKDCKFSLPGTSTDDLLLGSTITFKDCEFSLGNDSKIVASDCRAVFLNPTFTVTSGGTQPIIEPSSSGCDVTVIGADLSSADRDLFEPGLVGGNRIEIVGCVKNASYDLVVDTAGNISRRLISGSDTTAGNNQWIEDYSRSDQHGVVGISDAVYRDGGATYDGLNNYSIVIEPGTVSVLDFPTWTQWNSVYVGAQDGVNVEVEVANTVGSLNDDDLFLEVEYFSDVNTTLKTVATSKPNPLDTPAALTSSSETWTGISETAQTLTLPAAINIKKAGMLRWRIGSAISRTIYACPKIAVA
jgi:hypothetical protein